MIDASPVKNVVNSVEVFQQKNNEQRFPELLDAVTTLRSVLHTFRQFDFTGVPTTRKFSIRPVTVRKGKREHSYPCFQLCGRWLEDRGFHSTGHIRVIALKGLFIICPENFPDDDIEQSVAESRILFQ